MTSPWRRWLGLGIKTVLALVILFFVGWQFRRDLEKLDLHEINLQPGWLCASGAIFLIALFPNAWFWRHLLKFFGYPVSLYAAARAHYVGQLGKYSPGKAMAIAMRSHLIHPHGVPYGVSIIATFYEVLTSMAAGGIVAAVIYMIEPPGELDIGWHPVAIGAVLIGMCGIPLLPGVFNFVVGKLTARIQAVELYRLPPIGVAPLALGLTVSIVGWGLQGLSVWALLHGVLPEPPPLTVSAWAQCTAAIAFANVAGFVVFILPAGFGVRELFLSRLLSTLGPGTLLTAAAILLRLEWIVAEVVLVLCIYWLKPKAPDLNEPRA